MAFAFEHHLDQVLADAMEVTLDGADADLAGGLHTLGSQQGLEQFGAHAYGAGSDQHLGNKNFVVLEFFANDIHAVQQTLLQDRLGTDAFVNGLLDQSLDYLCFAGLKLNRNLVQIHFLFLLIIEIKLVVQCAINRMWFFVEDF